MGFMPMLKPPSCKTGFCFGGTVAEAVYSIDFSLLSGLPAWWARSSWAALYGSDAAVPWAVSIYSWPPRWTVAPLISAPHQTRSPSGLARERPPSTASRAWGSLTPSAPPTHSPCPSQATLGLALPHLQRKRNKNKIKWTLLVTPFWPDFLPITSSPHPTSPRVGGHNASAAFTGTERGDALAETNMHPCSMVGPQFAPPLPLWPRNVPVVCLQPPAGQLVQWAGQSSTDHLFRGLTTSKKNNTRKYPNSGFAKQSRIFPKPNSILPWSSI